MALRRRAAAAALLLAALLPGCGAVYIGWVSDSQGGVLGDYGMYKWFGPAVQKRLTDSGLIGGTGAGVHVSYDFGSGRLLATKTKQGDEDWIWRHTSTVAEAITQQCTGLRPDVLLILGTVNTIKDTHWPELTAGQLQSDVCAVVNAWREHCQGAPLIWSAPLPFNHGKCNIHFGCQQDWGNRAHFRERQQMWDMLDGNISAAASGAICGAGQRPEYLSIGKGITVARETGDGAHYGGSETINNVMDLFMPRTVYWSCLTQTLVDTMGPTRAREYCAPLAPGGRGRPASTQAPHSRPTRSPVRTPTRGPAQPTQQPSASPSTWPSFSPTQYPTTAYPSGVPQVGATPSPSQPPTKYPSDYPSEAPSAGVPPTRGPTAISPSGRAMVTRLATAGFEVGRPVPPAAGASCSAAELGVLQEAPYVATASGGEVVITLRFSGDVAAVTPATSTCIGGSVAAALGVSAESVTTAIAAGSVVVTLTVQAPSDAPTLSPATATPAAPVPGAGPMLTTSECAALSRAGFFNGGTGTSAGAATASVNPDPPPNASWSANRPNGYCNGTLNSSNAHWGENASPVGALNATGPGVNSTACAAARDAKLWAVALIMILPVLVWEGVVYLLLRRVQQVADDGTPPTCPLTPPGGRTGRARPTSPLPAAAGEGNAGTAEARSPGREVPTEQEPQPEEPPRPVKRPPPQSKGIEGLRAAAALHIAAFHLFQTLKAGGTEYSCNFCGFGKYQVQHFMLLSGFMAAASKLAKGGDPEPVVGFLRRRLLPLWPLHLLCLTFSAAWLGGYRGIWSGENTKGVLLSIPLLQSIIPPFIGSGLNGPAWFLSNLMVFWARFPHWLIAAESLPPVPACIATFCIYAVTYLPTMVCYAMFDYPLRNRWYGNDLHNFIEFHPLSNWPAFVLGILSARLAAMASLPNAPGAAACVLRGVRRAGITIPIAAMIAFFVSAPPPGFQMGTYYLLIDKGALSLPLFIPLVISAHCEPMQDWCGRRVLELLAPLGVLSWPLYITHEAFGDALREALRGAAGDSPYAALWLFPVTLLALAALARVCVDTPVRKLCAKLERRLRGEQFSSLRPPYGGASAQDERRNSDLVLPQWPGALRDPMLTA
eukprot:TRINITY_DN9366_c0_g1_i1.p1 TRINITY_DN9366_c0_g1~~TRINITY_DN9366_c0_g1_i1.p1  ORF type:complete len:1136 (+),score=194.78 TRINITY_DN9366_c0_g1_i1:74-3409(+)